MDKPAFLKKPIFINSFRRKNDVQMCTRVRRPKGDKCRARGSPVDISVFPADLSTGLCIDAITPAFDCSQAASNIVLGIEKREQFAGLNRPAHDRLRRGAARMPTRGETGNCPLRVLRIRRARAKSRAADRRASMARSPRGPVARWAGRRRPSCVAPGGCGLRVS